MRAVFGKKTSVVTRSRDFRDFKLARGAFSGADKLEEFITKAEKGSESLVKSSKNLEGTKKEERTCRRAVIDAGQEYSTKWNKLQTGQGNNFQEPNFDDFKKENRKIVRAVDDAIEEYERCIDDYINKTKKMADEVDKVKKTTLTKKTSLPNNKKTKKRIDSIVTVWSKLHDDLNSRKDLILRSRDCWNMMKKKNESGFNADITREFLKTGDIVEGDNLQKKIQEYQKFIKDLG